MGRETKKKKKKKHKAKHDSDTDSDHVKEKVTNRSRLPLSSHLLDA